ncbi:hypothetical protein ABPG72_016382 [Tetrahymena utriculariae]
MKSQEYSLFPQQRTKPQDSYQQEILFSPQQNWRVTTANKPPIVQIQTQPVFLPQQTVPSSGRIPQLPVQYVLPPQQIVPVLASSLTPQQKMIYPGPQQVNQQGYTDNQKVQWQQVQNKEIKQIQEKAQENQQKLQQKYQLNPIHSYRQQLIQEQVRSEIRNDKQKEIEKKIHEEILSQSKKVYPSQSIQQTQSPFKQTKSLLQNINIHHNEQDLHIQQSNKNQFYQQPNQQQNQLPSNLLISRSYVQLPQQSTTVQYLPPLASSQIRVIQPPAIPTTTLLTSQVKVLNPPIITASSKTNTRLIPTKTSKLILNQIGTIPITSSSTVLTPQPQLVSQQVIRQSPVIYNIPLVLSQQQQHQNVVKISQIIQSPKNQVSQENEFAINSRFRSFQTERENFQRNPDFIKSIDGGFGTERVTKANKTETNLNVHQQQVREIIQQSKYLLQNDILHKNEELNQQYQGLKQCEKLSLQNRLDQDKFFQDFEMRRMQFNKKLQKCSQPLSAEINEVEDKKNIQSNLYIIHQQRPTQIPAQNTSKVDVSQNISLQNNRPQPQNVQIVQQVQKNFNLKIESQTLKQPILTEYEQSLINQQQSTSNFPNSSRNQTEKTSPSAQLRDKNIQGQTKDLMSQQEEEVQLLDLKNIQTTSNNQQKDTEKQQQNANANYQQDEELEDNQSYQQPEPSISNQINQQDGSRSSTVHQAIQNDVANSQHHQEFKQKFLKSKDQFYQEKSQLSDRSKQLQQSQVQESENKDVQLVQQQYLYSRGQANQLLIDQIANTNQSQQSNRYQLVDDQADQQNQMNNSGVNQQSQQQQQEQNSQQNQASLQQQQQLIQQQNIQQIQQQYLQSRGQVNEQLLSQINNDQDEDQLGDLASNSAHVEQQDQKNHSGQHQKIDLYGDQQEYQQNRGQINQLFLQSLEKNYQQQFNQGEEYEDENNENHQEQQEEEEGEEEEEEEEEDEDEQNHPQDNYQEQYNYLIDQDENDQYENQLLPRENFESEEEYQRYLEVQQEYFDMMNQHQVLTPDHFDNEEEYNQYIQQIQNIQQMQQQNMNLQQMQQQYLMQRAGANQQLMQQFYQNQQYQTDAESSNHNQQDGEDLINFDDYQNQENIQKQNQNIQDMNQEFENEHNQQINTKIHNQQFQQEILNQQINLQGNQQFIQQLSFSQNKQVNTPQHYDDEERLVMLREQQLLQEKRKRDEERQQKIQQIEQDELMKQSSHSLGNQKNSLNPYSI